MDRNTLGCWNIADLRERARRRLPRGVWEYLERGTEDELGMARNRAALDAVTFRPRVLRGVESVDLSTSLLGCDSALPLVVAPTGAAGLLWYEGDRLLAEGAASAGVPFTISSASTMDLPDIAAAGGTQWFQLYMWQDRDLSYAVVDRAAELGCEVLMITLDMPVPPNREYLHRSGFGTPFRLNARNAIDLLAHPRWLAGVMGRYALGGGIPSQANLPRRLRSRVTESAPVGALFKQDDLDWESLKKLRDRWPSKLVLKGVMHPDDARMALSLGADGVVVSNHGGRALDSSMASLHALPQIAEAVGTDMTVLFDSGIRRGGDVVKALALGAHAAMVGRAPIYGLAAAGRPGVARALALLREEIRRTMAMIGARSIEEIDRSVLAPRSPW